MYLIIDRNSPELAVENGEFNIGRLYANKEKGMEYLEQRIEEEKDFGYYCIERTGTELTFYWNGDSSSPLWFTVELIKVELAEGEI